MAGFIIENLEEIIAEWESFARIVSPASATMSGVALRDHVRQMLQAIAMDIETRQSSDQQELKSKGLAPDPGGGETAAETHGSLRHTAGFDLGELVAEFRALRATVLRLWMEKKRYGDPAVAYEMARFNEAIDQALAESVATYSEELALSRDTFLAILGHDLRSPLAAIGGALHILAGPARDSERAEAAAIGSRSVAAMGAMIQDLLEYTRRQLGKGIPVAPAQANLGEVCSAALKEAALAHPQTAFRFESGGRLDGLFDAARISQVVSNLLNNAVQHGRRGLPVFLIVGSNEADLTLEVRNQGIPIPLEMLQVIFDPLVQVPTGQDDPRHFANLGLGLFIAREIVLAHGGTIRVSSSEKDGTTFRVVMPCASSPTRAVGYAGAQTALPATPILESGNPAMRGTS